MIDTRVDIGSYGLTPGEVFVAVLDDSEQLPDDVFPDVWQFPRYYNWHDPTGRRHQPPLMRIACGHEWSARPGRIVNLAEEHRDVGLELRPLPAGLPVFVMVIKLPPLAGSDDCGGPFIPPGFVPKPPPLLATYVWQDPLSTYCGETPGDA